MNSNQIVSPNVGNIVLAFVMTIFLSNCGGGGNGGSSSSGTIFPPEFIEDPNGDIIGYVYKSDIQFDRDSRYPETMEFHFDFSKPVRRDGNFIVTLEPETRVTLRENPLITDVSSNFFRADFHVWDQSGTQYPGRFYDHDIKPAELFYANYPDPKLGLTVLNQNMSNGWFSWYTLDFTDLRGRFDPQRNEVEIRSSGVYFQPWRVAIREFMDGVLTGDGGVGFNSSANFLNGAQIEETYDRSTLIANSPWFSVVVTDVDDGIGNIGFVHSCGNRYQFREDGVVELQNSQLSTTANYSLSSEGELRIDNGDLVSIQRILTELSRMNWSSFSDIPGGLRENELGYSSDFAADRFKSLREQGLLSEECGFGF